MGTEERQRQPFWERGRGGDAEVGKGRGWTMPDFIERLRCAKEFSLPVLKPGV